ncbi:hypothetical protein J6590_087083 [Homalodisca vitripennis]|nr:hypothetical protein J6590_087083 [Homalodisca vitripennis]
MLRRVETRPSAMFEGHVGVYGCTERVESAISPLQAYSHTPPPAAFITKSAITKKSPFQNGVFTIYINKPLIGDIEAGRGLRFAVSRISQYQERRGG